MNRLLVQYFREIENLGDRQYIALLTIYHIAPTIAGLKPATIITFGKNRRNLNEIWGVYKCSLRDILNIDYFEIKRTNASVNVLFFYRDLLRKSIYNKKNMEYLKEFGYSSNMNLEECLEHLKKRFEKQCPHEIGIFLGIPLEDVKAFTEKPERECLMRGYWKVYSNPHRARAEFEKYDLTKEYLIKSIID